MPIRYHSKGKHNKLMNRKQWIDWYNFLWLRQNEEMYIIIIWKNRIHHFLSLRFEGDLLFTVEITFNLSMLCILINLCNYFSLIVPFNWPNYLSCAMTSCCICFNLHERSFNLLLFWLELRLSARLVFLGLMDREWKYYSLGSLFSQ